MVNGVYEKEEKGGVAPPLFQLKSYHINIENFGEYLLDKVYNNLLILPFLIPLKKLGKQKWRMRSNNPGFQPIFDVDPVSNHNKFIHE